MKASRVFRLLAPLILPLVLLTWWWIASRNSTSPYFPPLSASWEAFVKMLEPNTFALTVLPTVIKFLVGYAIGSFLGIVIGLWFGRSTWMRQTFMPLTEFARAMPVAALVPSVMLLLGPTDSMEIFLVVFATIWPALLSTVDGVRASEPLLDDVSDVHGWSGLQKMRWITLPTALPQMMAGLRIGLALGLQIVIIAGMLAGTDGLGTFALNAQTSYDITSMWAGIFTLALIGVVTGFLFMAVEHRLLRWHRGWRAQERGNTT